MGWGECLRRIRKIGTSGVRRDVCSPRTATLLAVPWQTSEVPQQGLGPMLPNHRGTPPTETYVLDAHWPCGFLNNIINKYFLKCDFSSQRKDFPECHLKYIFISCHLTDLKSTGHKFPIIGGFHRGGLVGQLSIRCCIKGCKCLIKVMEDHIIALTASFLPHCYTL